MTSIIRSFGSRLIYLSDFWFWIPFVLILIGSHGSHAQTYTQNLAENHLHVQWVTSRPFWNVECIEFCDAQNGWAARGGLVLHSTDGGITWEQQYTGREDNYKHVVVFNSQTCVLMTDYGRIIHTADAGKTWINVYEDHSLQINDVQKLEDGSVFCRANSSSLLKSTDMGSTWDVLDITNQKDEDQQRRFITGLHFFNRDKGIAWNNGVGSILHQTNDGGKTWKSWKTKGLDKLEFICSSNRNRPGVWGIFFQSPKKGYLYNTQCPGVAAISRHRGKKWKWVKFSESRHKRLYKKIEPLRLKARIGFVKKGPMKIMDKDGRLLWEGTSDWDEECLSKPVYFFLNEQLGWMAVRHERLLARTTDGGKTWINTVDRPPISFIRDMVVPRPGTVLMVGGDNHGFMRSRITEPSLVKSTDQGKTWEIIFGEKEHFASSVFFKGKHGWVTTPELQSGPNYKENRVFTSHDWGTTWQYISTLPKVTSERYRYQSRDFYGNCFESEESSPLDLATKSIQFADSLYGIQHLDLHYRITKDGGKTWKKLPIKKEEKPPSSAHLREILNAEKNNTETEGEVALVKAGTLIKADQELSITVNSGQTWKQVFSSGADYKHIFFLDSLHGWAWEHPKYSREPEPSQMLAHTTNGGKTWIENSINIPKRLFYVKFVSPKEGWAVNDFVRHTLDGGQTWETVPEIHVPSIMCITAINENEVWFGTDQGLIVKWKR